MTAILGINFNHADAAATLVMDGRVVAAIAEERLGKRAKHDSRFPANAIRRVLDIAGIAPRDLTHVAVARNTAANRIGRLRYVLANPARAMPSVMMHLQRRNREQGVLSRVAAACDADPTTLKAALVPVEHHLCHVASAYYCSPFDGLTAGMSYDGSGDFASFMACRCEGTNIEILDRVLLPHSLGFFYSAICQFIGFDLFGEEYKVMGLAPYGEDRFAKQMGELLHAVPGGWFALSRKYFSILGPVASAQLDDSGQISMGRMYSDELVRLLGQPRRRSDEMTQRDKDLARSCQVRFEEVAMHCVRRLHSLVPTNRIAYAGGCALNGVANARLLRDTPFTDAYLQAASADDGTCIGAALWAWHNVAGGTARFHMHHAYWGPEYPEAEMRRSAEGCNMPQAHVGSDQLPEVAARILRAGLVMGWYQGRSEWGPRALGNRSILADPTQPQMKDLINAKIKRREMFRPFAPTVVRRAVDTYFEQDVFSPFMMHVVKIRPQYREKLPSITHVDGTGRLQSIERTTNALYYDLIEALGRLSGIPIVLNTSFNENEPIVDTPDQAMQCFLRTGLDALVLGRHVIVKPEHEATLRSVVAGG
jgi:carbamoyltransferase